MRKRALKVLIIMLCITIPIVICLLWFHRINTNNQALRMEDERNAIVASERYITDNFEQEFVFEGYHTPFKGGRYVLYSKKDDPDFILKIDLYIDPETSEFQVMRDDYFETVLEAELEKKYRPIVEEIWNDAYVGISIGNIFLREIRDSLNEFSTIEDIAYDDLNKNYRLHIRIPYFFQEEDKNREAEKIYDLINILRKGDYLPSHINIRRFKDEKFSTSEVMGLYNLSEITLVQIHEEIEKHWFVDN
ncbi:MAG: hypothetical protein LBC73_04855 [Oscillospiraceae bacterium]|jgi:hypothetical protein|nr:hypothetical protein [Oscillospiraceae bacterium]